MVMPRRVVLVMWRVVGRRGRQSASNTSLGCIAKGRPTDNNNLTPELEAEVLATYHISPTESAVAL
jgi:hypothetical protein